MHATISVAVTLAAACSNQTSTPGSVAPPSGAHAVDEPGAKTLATRLEAAARPCDVSQVAALFDRKEFLRLVHKRAPGQDEPLRAVELFFSTAANKFCAWVERATEVRVLWIRS